MSVGGTLSVLVGATIAPLQKGLKQAEGVVHNFSGGVSKFLAGPGGIGGAIAGAIGGATVAAGLKIAVDRFKAVEDASTKAAAAITMTGGAAGVSLDQVQASAKALSQQTTIGTASAINMGTALLRSGQLGEGVFDEALTQSANMAAALGMEGPAAAEKLAAALKNPREGYLELAAAGVRFTEEQLKMIPALQAAGDKAGAQNIILQALNAQMGDAAKLAGETLSGQMDKLWNSFDNIAAIVGEAVAPILKSLVGEVTGFAQSLDTAQGKAKVFEVVGKTIGYTADAAQLLAIGWKTAQVGMDALVLAGVKGFEWLLKGIQYAVDGAAALGWVSEDTAKGFGRFVKEVEAFSAGAESNLASDGKAAADAWNEPWASAKIEQKFKSIANASQDAGKKMAESFSEPMKQLSKETAEAHGEIDKLVKDLRVGIETFGMSDTEKKAKELATKGVGQDKIDEFRTLSNELKGKELAKSLENPIEKFQREMSKLAELKDNLSPEMFQRAQSKLVKELQDAVPDMKTTAGGAMAAGSQEARSALVAYANSGRNNDPQQKLVQINEQQKVILESANRALQRLASPNAMGQGGLPFPGL